MRQAGMVRAGGRSGVGNGAEDRKAEDRKAENGTADGRRTDGREAEGRKRDGGMGKWVRPGGQEKKLGGFVYYFADKRGGYCGLSGGDRGNEPVREQRRRFGWGVGGSASFADVVFGFGFAFLVGRLLVTASISLGVDRKSVV